MNIRNPWTIIRVCLNVYPEIENGSSKSYLLKEVFGGEPHFKTHLYNNWIWDSCRHPCKHVIICMYVHMLCSFKNMTGWGLPVWYHIDQVFSSSRYFAKLRWLKSVHWWLLATLQHKAQAPSSANIWPYLPNWQKTQGIPSGNQI
jgi:hypothetical protein